MLLVEAPLDQIGLLQSLEAGGQRIGADALKRQLKIEELERPFAEQVADNQDCPAVTNGRASDESHGTPTMPLSSRQRYQEAKK
jgi:hypothetical protein